MERANWQSYGNIQPYGEASGRSCNRRHKTILTKNSDIGPHTRPRLLSFFEDTQKLHHLKIELATVADWGEPFVKATYNLEGDGPLAFTCFETIQKVVTSIQVKNIPNVQAVAKRYFPKPYYPTKANNTCQAVH